MDYFYIFTGLFVQIIAFLKRELLIQKESFKIILGISVVLFFVGLALHFTEVGRESSCGALLVPIMSLGLYCLCRKAFLRRFKREPKDTYLNWEGGLGADRLFNVVYFVSSQLLLMLSIIGAMELAKAGW
jgi:hypothetical protein